jgi:hypothetical protein
MLVNYGMGVLSKNIIKLNKSKLTITSISFILLEEYNNDVSSANSLDKL